MMTKTICITGAAGNLGSLTAQHLFDNSDYKLNLMVHNKQFDRAMKDDARVTIYKCDLNKKETIKKCLQGVDEVIHYAGILFAAQPEKFLPTTNTKYFKNLVDVAKSKAVKRITLISFHTLKEIPTLSFHPQTK